MGCFDKNKANNWKGICARTPEARAKLPLNEDTMETMKAHQCGFTLPLFGSVGRGHIVDRGIFVDPFVDCFVRLHNCVIGQQRYVISVIVPFLSKPALV